jgi:hypothetical protein
MYFAHRNGRQTVKRSDRLLITDTDGDGIWTAVCRVGLNVLFSFYQLQSGDKPHPFRKFYEIIHQPSTCPANSSSV